MSRWSIVATSGAFKRLDGGVRLVGFLSGCGHCTDAVSGGITTSGAQCMSSKRCCLHPTIPTLTILLEDRAIRSGIFSCEHLPIVLGIISTFLRQTVLGEHHHLLA